MASNTTWSRVTEERANMAYWEWPEYPRLERSMDSKTTLFQTHLETTELPYPKSLGFLVTAGCMGHAEATELLLTGRY
jgi:hypothetical protein